MAEIEIKWGRVARHLKDESNAIVARAQSAFATDLQTQQEMRTRAAILSSLAEAIWAGLE
jgi:hypothetical protein